MEVFGRSFQISPYFLKISIKQIVFCGFFQIFFSGIFLEFGNSEKIEIKIVHSGVGEINESDVTLATASDARIFGFNVKANVQAKNLSKREKIFIKYFKIDTVNY